MLSLWIHPLVASTPTYVHQQTQGNSSRIADAFKWMKKSDIIHVSSYF